MRACLLLALVLLGVPAFGGCASDARLTFEPADPPPSYITEPNRAMAAQERHALQRHMIRRAGD